MLCALTPAHKSRVGYERTGPGRNRLLPTAMEERPGTVRELTVCCHGQRQEGFGSNIPSRPSLNPYIALLFQFTAMGRKKHQKELASSVDATVPGKKRKRAAVEPDEEDEEDVSVAAPLAVTPAVNNTPSKKERKKQARKAKKQKLAEAEAAAEVDADLHSARASVAEPNEDDMMEQVAQVPVSNLEGLSPDKARQLKGKGKMQPEGASGDVPAPAAEATAAHVVETQRIIKELAFKDDMLHGQTNLLASLKSSISCNICLEMLDRPYSLACGHAL